MRETSKNFYLWGVSYESALRIVDGDVNKALLNLRIRLEHEVEAVRQLANKAEMERLSGTSMLTDQERAELDLFLRKQDRLEISIIKLAESASMLREF